jgi:hypothetical protein
MPSSASSPCTVSTCLRPGFTVIWGDEAPDGTNAVPTGFYRMMGRGGLGPEIPAMRGQRGKREDRCSSIIVEHCLGDHRALVFVDERRELFAAQQRGCQLGPVRVCLGIREGKHHKIADGLLVFSRMCNSNEKVSTPGIQRSISTTRTRIGASNSVLDAVGFNCNICTQ